MKTTNSTLGARLIGTTESICSLPAIPTHDWASQAAEALARLSPSSLVGILIAQLDPNTSSLSPISTGVSHAPDRDLSADNNAIGQNETNPDAKNQAFFLQDKLERATTLGFAIPQHACTRGLVAPLSLLDTNPSATPLGRIFAAQQLQSPIIAIVPITHAHPGFVLIVTIAFEKPTSTSSSPFPIDTVTQSIADLLPLLARKAELALSNVNNPKAWLTDREHEILNQLILGYSVRIIADNLERSTHTVHDHVKNLHKKLDATSRGQLIAKSLGFTSREAQSTESKDISNQISPIVFTGTSSLAELKPTNPPSEPDHHSANSSMPHAKAIRRSSNF